MKRLKKFNLQKLRLPKSRREFLDWTVSVILIIAVIVAVVPFFLVIGDILLKGWMLLNPTFVMVNMDGFAGGGIRNAIVGSMEIVLVACIIAIPLCVGAAVYTTEYTKGGWFLRIVEFTADILAGVPSIIFGAFGLIFFVELFGRSLIAGAFTLALMMIPTILRTTQESMRAVPMSLREASLAVGATRWSTTWRVTVRAAFGGIMTGILLAVGRVIGETAPLLFTTGFNFDSPWTLLDAVATLPFTIYQYELLSADPLIRLRSNTTGLVLMIVVLGIDVIANILARKVGIFVRAG